MPQYNPSARAEHDGGGTSKSAPVRQAGRIFVAAISVLSAALVMAAAMIWIEAPRGDDGFPTQRVLYAVALLSIGGMLLDLADGACARLLNVASSFGRFLDLFCDVAANTLPPLAILVLLPVEFGGQPVPRAIVWGVSLLYLAAVLVHYAQVATRQLAERTTRFSRYRTLPVTVVPVFLAGWLLACVCDTPVPGGDATIAEIARANTAIVTGMFALGAILVSVPLRYPRIPEFALDLYFPWHFIGVAILLLAPELIIAAIVAVYTASPALAWARLAPSWHDHAAARQTPDPR